MKRTFELTIFLVATICLFSSNTNADVVLTFEQSGVVNGSALDPAYGDRVVESPDDNGHVYDIVIGSLLGSTTPNVEVDYVGTGEPRIWTAGYGDLPFVLFDDLDFENGFGVEFTADPGFEVGIVGFDLAAFGSDQAIPGVEIVNGSGTSLWSASSPTVSGSTLLNQLGQAIENGQQPLTTDIALDKFEYDWNTVVAFGGDVASAFNKLRDQFGGEVAMNRVLRILLALHTADDAADRDSWSPEYLQSIGVPKDFTIDPYTGDPMTIKRVNNQWLVYSCGYDHTDDGGDCELDLRYGFDIPCEE